ncbi:hypothetical protein AXG93_3818s1180 [Marchantia polymorpha subsp. ruderalis]|uniref:Uncharacterized protein n=1 Tax=Marchantia polymorpha subsp. ruderalis TaxID=1480154 RepID=A0A176VGY1_MARPO|nr:hypothetical protein AXG93_3818s1180 [Marchantia polymorpha subsp. ruderalis]
MALRIHNNVLAKSFTTFSSLPISPCKSWCLLSDGRSCAENAWVGRSSSARLRSSEFGRHVLTNGRLGRARVISPRAGLDVPISSEEIPVKDGTVLTGDGSELSNTLRLVECSMLAATAGLAYFLSNLFRLELGTAMLLLVLSGPLKAASYLVRSLGAVGFVLLSSWLLRENLLALITVNAHASFSYILAAVGINIVPTMLAIYFVFAGLLLINCGSFVFLLHVLYAIFLKRLGIPMSIAVPGWIERAI